MTHNNPTTAAPATMEKFDHYLVSEVKVKPGALPVFSGRPESVEMLPGSFSIERMANATVIFRSDDDDLPFRGVRLTCEGYVPVIFYGSDRRGFLVSDNPEPGVTIDDLNEDDRAKVRGEKE